MGYCTEFAGEFLLDTPLPPEHAAYLRLFAGTKRMKRRAAVAAEFADPVREAAQLVGGIGFDAGYFVGGFGASGQNIDSSVVGYSQPPAAQPNQWCGWTASDDGRAIVWGGSEKFEDYVEWLEYIIGHFLRPWGYKLTGVVAWRGDEFGDVGRISVCENVVAVQVFDLFKEDMTDDA